MQAQAVSLLIVQWTFAHGFIASSWVKFEARTADIKPTLLWTDGHISAVSAFFMLAKLAFGSFSLAGHDDSQDSAAVTEAKPIIKH